MLFTADTLTRLAAAGLTILGLGGPVATGVVDTGPTPDAAPQTVEVASLPEAPGSRIDPSLLENATLRRAISMVGPDLVADPAIREAIRTGRADPSLMNNPTVQRAMLRVGPMIMADPELSAAIRSGELSPDLLNDPAVRSTLRALDPTLFDEPVIEPVDEPIVAPTLRELPEVEPTVEAEAPAAEVTVAEVANDERRRGRAWGHARDAADHPRHRARGEAPAPNERATDRERPGRRILGALVRVALDLATGGPNAR